MGTLKCSLLRRRRPFSAIFCLPLLEARVVSLAHGDRCKYNVISGKTFQIPVFMRGQRISRPKRSPFTGEWDVLETAAFA